MMATIAVLREKAVAAKPGDFVSVRPLDLLYICQLAEQVEAIRNQQQRKPRASLCAHLRFYEGRPRPGFPQPPAGWLEVWANDDVSRSELHDHAALCAVCMAHATQFLTRAEQGELSP